MQLRSTTRVQACRHPRRLEPFTPLRQTAWPPWLNFVIAQVSLEEAKLLQKQTKELEALRTRCTATRDEAHALQRRDLEQLSKRFQVARMELAKSQGLAKVDLDWALKGWFNPRKVSDAELHMHCGAF